ncbi:MAG TPA: hypothetical protein VIA06_15555 [Candidatus Dormibacteraeota bacterium]|jgi:hypothetical protein|nr:hypothetical protein [Candidatus Dormibacteraeota bacterium]
MRQIRTPARLPIFRSGPQAELLTRLYLEPERSWTARDLGLGIDVSRVTIRS